MDDEEAYGSGKEPGREDGGGADAEMALEAAGVEEDIHVSDEEGDQAKEAKGDHEFKLVGVVCHMGAAEAGHYLSYINVERDRENSDSLSKKPREEWLATENQKWLEFNDDLVSDFDFKQQLEQTCFGGQQNQNAYMLIYERRVKEKMKVVVPKEVMQALACDGTAMTSADNHLFEVFPKLREQIIQNKEAVVQYDAEKDEHLAMVNFDDARKFVPNSIYKMVHRDNQKFLAEKQVFSDAFYQCSLQLLQLSIL
jgi:ubiquitin carboxyl-terminal hydrolase 34